MLHTLELVLIKDNEANIYKDSKNYFVNKRMKQALKRITYDSEFKTYNKDYFIIIVNKNGNVFNFLVRKDELETKTIMGFFLWVLFCSIILSIISYLFIKNQIKPLSRLGIITRSFGRGIDMPDIRPTGSTEIKGLIKDFNNMKKNINETINDQKNMLAGISHDLRTPLTRINLMTDNIENEEIKLAINNNVNEMNIMIEHYIDFIKNEKEEFAEKIKSNIFISDILKQYKNITLDKNDTKEIKIKRVQITRAIQNVLENSQKFAKNTFVNSYFKETKWIISIEDDGPGIDLSPEEIVKPFVKGKNNLNQGSGLGLSILKKIIDLNNGKIQFSNSIHSGLKVHIELNNVLE